MSRRRHVISVSHGFGARLTVVLADQHITQQTLAEKLHASPSFVSALARGLKAPGLEFIVALHGVLGVSLNWLILGTGRMYGDDVDSDLLQGALLQVQLARLATAERRPEAAALLRNAMPGIDLPPPMPPPATERLDAFLDALLTGNQDVPVAISLMNTVLLRVPAPDRPRAIAVAIEEMVRSRLSPSILHLLKPTTVEAGLGDKRDAGDTINWEREPLPLPNGRKIGDLQPSAPLATRATPKSRLKPKTRGLKK